MLTLDWPLLLWGPRPCGVVPGEDGALSALPAAGGSENQSRYGCSIFVPRLKDMCICAGVTCVSPYLCMWTV